MRFYTWTNDIDHKNLTLLKESAQKYGINLNYLGSDIGAFPLNAKLKLLYDELCKIDDHEIICAVDGFDVFFCSGAAEIKRRFISFNCDCVISAEREYSHQYGRYREFYDGISCDSPYRHVNSGSIIGYARAIKKIYAPTLETMLLPKMFASIRNIKTRFNLKDVFPQPYYFDQKHIGKYIAKNLDNLNVKLDHDTKIFWCTAFEWEDIDSHFKLEGSKIINSHTNNVPLIIHVPGWCKYGSVLTKLFEIQKSLNEKTRMD